MTLFMAVDLNDNELPLAVAETAAELARICGVSERTVHSAISNVKAGRTKRSKYIRVVVEETIEEDKE